MTRGNYKITIYTAGNAQDTWCWVAWRNGLMLVGGLGQAPNEEDAKAEAEKFLTEYFKNIRVDIDRTSYSYFFDPREHV